MKHEREKEKELVNANPSENLTKEQNSSQRGVSEAVADNPEANIEEKALSNRV